MAQSILERFKDNSYLFGANASYIESLYDDYLRDPGLVDQYWQDYFMTLPQVGGFSQKDVVKTDLIEQFRELAKAPAVHIAVSGGASSAQAGVDALINSFRRFAHRSVQVDPLKRCLVPVSAHLSLAYHGLDVNDQNLYLTQGIFGDDRKATIEAIDQRLRSIYLSDVGFEYQYIGDTDIREWLQKEIESENWGDELPDEDAIQVLKELIAAEGLEKYLDTKYVGQTRFSLSGSEGIIPLLAHLIRSAMRADIKTLALGMAHRGRVNVLLNLFGKLPQKLYDEFDGKYPVNQGTGDIKYHNGYSTDIAEQDHQMHMTLAFNPSHLEFITPVVMGGARARQTQHPELAPEKAVLPVFIHGDAAFSGEGVVMETLQMSNTNAYGVGGSLHVILNNQIGFTTSRVTDARTAPYAASTAMMIEAPIFHVQGESFSAIYKVVSLALAYRMKFKRDVVIDFVGFRRPGHNEADEPRVTQPMMYQQVDAHPGVASLYTDYIIKRELCDKQTVKSWQKVYRQSIASGDVCMSLLPVAKPADSKLYTMWKPFLNQRWDQTSCVGFPLDRLQALAQSFYAAVPKDYQLHPRVAGILKSRRAMASGEQLIDWGFAENLAYASLLDQGYSVRMTGQDARRGTFFHRHHALFNQRTGQSYEPLSIFGNDHVRAEIHDSFLSEAAVLGFEYGYSASSPQGLVIWEAQFGDFANAAQVIIDQFISSGWQKWRRLSGLVMLLPHGYEGRGPEHSSARLERFMQLCAQDNIQVCVPSTPAQIFHLLRRQVLRQYRRPLVVMTPKSLLRHADVVSSIQDLAEQNYQLVINDTQVDPKKIKRAVLCSGKVYYDLLAARRAHDIKDIALLRLEQLYPFPYDAFKAMLAPYKNLEELVWCQEEPKNQGAWFISKHRFLECIAPSVSLIYAGREPMAAPAPGYSELFKQQQQALIDDALNLSTNNE